MSSTNTIPRCYVMREEMNIVIGRYVDIVALMYSSSDLQHQSFILGVGHREHGILSVAHFFVLLIRLWLLRRRPCWPRPCLPSGRPWRRPSSPCPRCRSGICEGDDYMKITKNCSNRSPVQVPCSASAPPSTCPTSASRLQRLPLRRFQCRPRPSSG